MPTGPASSNPDRPRDPDGYLRAVRELCDEFGVLLICDEVAVGFVGRLVAEKGLDVFGETIADPCRAE